ncbi:cysteine desulfurase CsdA [Enterobacteriaceae bacterium LUAb1]
MTFFHPAKFRQHFPALENGGIYLDSAATALKPLAVIDATSALYRLNAATVHRSQFRSARHLTGQYEHARQQVATLLNAASPHEIIWTSGTTASINLVAQSWLRPRLQPGDNIIVSEAEHHANLVPWLQLAQHTGVQIIPLPLDASLLPDMDRLAELLSPRTRLLAISQMSNVTGGMPELARAIQLTHAAGAVVMIDGAQGVVHASPDMQQLDIDFYAFSAHKLYGPSGTGVLYGKAALLEQMQPWQGGGKMIKEVSFEGFTPQPIPWRFEAGTPNVAGVIGLHAALQWLATIDRSAAEDWSCELASQAEKRLSAIPGFRSFRASSAPILAFEIAGIHHNDMATLLAESGIAVRSGQHCAQPLMKALGVDGTLRASFAPYNTPQDVDALVKAMHHIYEILMD